MTSREKPGAAFWGIVVLAIVVLYVASFGPACWAADNDLISQYWTGKGYWPLVRLGIDGPEPIRHALESYAERHQRPAGYIQNIYRPPIRLRPRILVILRDAK